MGEAVEVWCGGVAAWECDGLGRLDAGFYMAKVMEGLVGLAAELGMPQAFAPHGEATLAVREQHIRFLREADARARLSIEAGVLEMGEEDARVLLLMRRHDGELAAAFDLRLAHITAREGRAFPWPAWARERAARLTLALPEEAAPRSLRPKTEETDASLERARTLGLSRIGMGAVRPGDLDPFGRLRPELVLARISESASHLLGEPLAAAGAERPLDLMILEHRSRHLNWPRMGERWELRSALTAVDPGLLKMIHWMLDPATGAPWAVAETVAAPFDLSARRIAALSEAELAPWRALCVPGL